MEIVYDILEAIETSTMASGCYTQCYMNSDCGSDYGC